MCPHVDDPGVRARERLITFGACKRFLPRMSPHVYGQFGWVGEYLVTSFVSAFVLFNHFIVLKNVGNLNQFFKSTNECFLSAKHSKFVKKDKEVG